jgi:hypothetical protein
MSEQTRLHKDEAKAQFARAAALDLTPESKPPQYFANRI